MDINILILFSFIYSNMNWNKTQESRVVLVDTESSAERMNEWMSENGAEWHESIANRDQIDEPHCRPMGNEQPKTGCYRLRHEYNNVHVYCWKRFDQCFSLSSPLLMCEYTTESNRPNDYYDRKKTRLSKQYVRACVHVYVSVQ